MANDTYIFGLDVLGMAPVTKPVTRPAAPRPVAPKPTTAAPKPSTPPPAKPTSSAAKVKAAKTHAAAVVNRAQKSASRLDRHKRKPKAAAISAILKQNASKLNATATKIKGVVFGDDADTVEWIAKLLDQQAQAADIAAQVYDVIDPLYAAGKDDLAREGETIVNACNYIVTQTENMRTINQRAM